MYGYFYKTKHYTIRFRTKELEYQHLPEQDFDWSTTVYCKVTEEMPKDAPELLGKPVITTTSLDANPYHDPITCRSVTTALHFVNTTPSNWYSKRHAAVENITHIYPTLVALMTSSRHK